MTLERGLRKPGSALLRIKIGCALNTAFSEWGNILHSTTIATAVVDRLVEDSEILLLGGESLRKAKKRRSLQK